MPYISKNNNRRKKLRKGEPALNAGELNYQIFYFVKHNIDKLLNTYPRIEKVFIRQIITFVNKFLGEKPNYQRYNDMTGCLVRCAKEIKRRLEIDAIFLFQMLDTYDNEIANYEDIKISSNGDVE